MTNTNNDPNLVNNSPFSIFQRPDDADVQDQVSQDDLPPTTSDEPTAKVHLSWLMAVLSGNIDASNTMMSSQATHALLLKYLQDLAETIANKWNDIEKTDCANITKDGSDANKNTFTTDQSKAGAANNNAETLTKGEENIVESDSKTLSDIDTYFQALLRIVDNKL